MSESGVCGDLAVGQVVVDASGHELEVVAIHGEYAWVLDRDFDVGFDNPDNVLVADLLRLLPGITWKTPSTRMASS